MNHLTNADILFREIKEHLGNPPVYLLDVRPAQGYPLGLICSHEVAEQISRATKALPYSMDKSPTMDFMEPMTGPHSILTRQVDLPPSLTISANAYCSGRRMEGFAPAIQSRICTTTSFVSAPLHSR